MTDSTHFISGRTLSYFTKQKYISYTFVLVVYLYYFNFKIN